MHTLKTNAYIIIARVLLDFKGIATEKKSKKIIFFPKRTREVALLEDKVTQTKERQNGKQNLPRKGRNITGLLRLMMVSSQTSASCFEES